MTTIRLQINDKVLDKVLKILGHFSNDEVEIIREDEDFLEQKEFVAKDLILKSRSVTKQTMIKEPSITGQNSIQSS